jgi:hypothetical protein
MTSSRQEYVVAFWKKSCSPRGTTSLRSAIAGGLLSCLSFDELLELLLSESAVDGRLRQKVVDRVADALISCRLLFAAEQLGSYSNSPR